MKNSYISDFLLRYPQRYLTDCLDDLKNLRVLVVGEAIIDEYHFGTALGKAAKEPILALKSISTEAYAGGSLAVANHLAGFCRNVGLVAMIGERDSRLRLIKRSLKKNVRLMPIVKQNAPTIVKRRFLEMSPFQKLLEFYVMEDSAFDPVQSRALVAKLKTLLPSYDMVICCDFGHGMLDVHAREVLMNAAPFLAVTAQANAGNFGYHTISKYPRADYVCLDERELRLEAKDRHGDPLSLMHNLMKRLKYRNLILTKGESGCFVYQRGKDILQVPSLTSRHKDRVGAGDAFLSITAPLLFQNVSADVAGFIGNAVGALAINIVGNKRSIRKEDLQELLTSLYQA